MGITCSPSATREKLHEMGQDHDKEVLTWKKELEQAAQTNAVLDVIQRTWPSVSASPWEAELPSESSTSDFNTLDVSSIFWSFRRQSKESLLKQAVHQSLQVPTHVVESTLHELVTLFRDPTQTTNSDDELFGKLHSKLCTYPEYQLIVDNIDFEKRAKHMGSEKQNESIHWMSGYAVKLEHPGHHLPDISPQKCLVQVPNVAFLPNDNDVQFLHKEFAVLWSRVITNNIPCLADLQRHVIWHMDNAHSESLSHPSSWVRNCY